MSSHKSTQLNCFSPPVMLATIIIEVGLAIYTAWRYKLTPFTRLATLMLVMLASFQVAEFFVCTNDLGHAQTWSRIGFAAITVLPPLGLHLMHVLAGKPARRLVFAAYTTMVGFIGVFLLYPSAFSNHECTGNYVIFHLHARLGGAYWLFYVGWLGVSFFLGGRWANELRRLGAKAQLQLRPVQALMIGWLVFIVPTVAANVASPRSRQGIPSIMCGFAVLFALVLALYIVPRAAQPKST
jgi:hypothetical protein